MDWLLEIFKLLVLLFEVSVSPAAKSTDTNTMLPDSVLVNPNYIVSRVASDTIFFTGGNFFKTGLYETEYIGKVDVGNKAPYLIYSGRYCNECDANLSLYVHSPDDGTPDVSNGNNRYAYPGKVSHYETGKPVTDTRVFYGEVIGRKKGVIWYISEYTETSDTVRTSQMILVSESEPVSYQWKGHAALTSSVQLMNTGRCFEIPGREFTSEP